jgi:hypothetical protein
MESTTYKNTTISRAIHLGLVTVLAGAMGSAGVGRVTASMQAQAAMPAPPTRRQDDRGAVGAARTRRGAAAAGPARPPFAGRTRGEMVVEGNTHRAPLSQKNSKKFPQKAWKAPIQ